MLHRENLHNYQVEACEFIKNTMRCAAWLDLGLGKSCTTLTAISDLIDSFDVRRVLVVAPLRVAAKTWPDEVAKWSHLSHLKIRAAIGSAKERLAALNDSTAHIVTINVENLTWMEAIYGEKLPFDMMVMDESSMFKNTTSQRFKTARRLARRIPRIVQLTATPSPNGYVDLFSQFYILDGGTRLFPSKSMYLERFFKKLDREGYKYALKKGAAEVIHHRIADITRTMKAKDYLEVPDRMDHTVYVDLSEEHRSLYEELERHFIVSLEEGDVTAFSAATVANKLMQVANGNVYGEEKAIHKLHTAKLDALREIIEEANEPVIVCYNFRSDLDEMMRAFPQARVLGKDTRMIDEWNRGEIPVMLIHPASAGHGLNLQHGGRIMVWYGLNWSLELYQQACARLHRQGQTKPVLVYHLLTRNTIDETVFAVLQKKDSTQEALLHAMKASASRVMSNSPPAVEHAA